MEEKVFSFVCINCGNDYHYTTIETEGEIVLAIKPCRDCVSRGYDRGYVVAYDRGFDDGFIQGLEEGESNKCDYDKFMKGLSKNEDNFGL